MAMTTVRGFVRPAAVLLTLMGAACDGMPVVLNERVFQIDGDALLTRGKSCLGFVIDGEWLPWEGGGSGTSGDVGGDFVLGTEFDDNGVSVTVMSRNKVMATRRYEKEFLMATKLDEIKVTTLDGDRYLLRYWGGGSCTPVDEDQP